MKTPLDTRTTSTKSFENYRDKLEKARRRVSFPLMVQGPFYIIASAMKTLKNWNTLKWNVLE